MNEKDRAEQARGAAIAQLLDLHTSPKSYGITDDQLRTVDISFIRGLQAVGEHHWLFVPQHPAYKIVRRRDYPLHDEKFTGTTGFVDKACQDIADLYRYPELDLEAIRQLHERYRDAVTTVTEGKGGLPNDPAIDG